MRSVINSLIDKVGDRVTTFTSGILARTQRDITYRRTLVGEKCRIGRNSIIPRDQQRCHRCSMRSTGSSRLDRAAALVDNVRTRQLRSAGVHRSVKKRDGHALTRVPLRPSSIQVIVREVLLRRNHILRTSRGRHQSKSAHSQHGRGGERGQGTRGAPRPPHTNARQAGRRAGVARRVHRVHLRWYLGLVPR